MRLDRVDPVAVRANRGQPIAAADSLPVNALHEGLLDHGMTLAAGRGNIEFVDRRLLIVGGKYLVRPVAIRTDRGIGRSLFGRQPMHAFLVRHKGLRALTVLFNQKFLPVTHAARDGNIAMIDGRLGVIGSKNFVRASMTIHTSCRRRSTGLGHLGVSSVRICILRIRMALGASDLPRRRFVDQALHIFVAIDATEHSAMNGMPQLVFIHIQADLAAVCIFVQSGVGVAGETVFVLQLLLAASGRGPDK